MKCSACDSTLTDFEATRKRADNEKYIDLCNVCWAPLAGLIEVLERYDLYEGDYEAEFTEATRGVVDE